MKKDNSRRTRLVLLGVTGSIGRQAVDVIRRFPEHFEIAVMTATGRRADVLIDLVRVVAPEVVVITNPVKCRDIRHALDGSGIQVLCGDKPQIQAASGSLVPVDMVLSAISGTAGLEPTVAAVEAGIDVALANKETLVSGGGFVMDTARRTGARILPVDSEHAAIHQCLKRFQPEEVARLILTCSGGPFSGKDIDLNEVTIDDALDHPTWNMGTKITVDSATLMNKGLEVIEARWLFDIPPDRIKVVIHPESIIHSMVEARDGSVIAQMSLPDMRLPILYALSGGRHLPLPYPKLELARLQRLHFDWPDMKRFPCLALAYEALRIGGTMPVVLNTANEAAVDAFCRHKIRFTDIPRIIESVMQAHEYRTVSAVSDIVAAARWADEKAGELITS